MEFWYILILPRYSSARNNDCCGLTTVSDETGNQAANMAAKHNIDMEIKSNYTIVGN